MSNVRIEQIYVNMYFNSKKPNGISSQSFFIRLVNILSIWVAK